MMRYLTGILFFISALGIAVVFLSSSQKHEDERFIAVTISDVSKVELYWKDDTGEILRSIGRLRSFVGSKGKRLKFAMNAGMFTQDNAPLGLFIERNNIVAPLNKATGNGNFYLQPNGVFYITTSNKAFIRKTMDIATIEKIAWATQSGPMLVIDGAIHSAFRKGSANLYIRNGVGVLPGNCLLFAISKQPVNLYDFAEYFRKSGCRNALYLDGFVSRMYAPSTGIEQVDGNVGVMIGIAE